MEPGRGGRGLPAWLRFLILVFLLVCPSAGGLEVSAGVKAGPGFPFFAGHSYWSALGGAGHTEPRLGGSVGLCAALGFDAPLQVGLEVLLSWLGGNWGDGYTTRCEHACVLEIPVVIGIRCTVAGSRVVLYAGPDIVCPAGGFGYRVTDAEGNLVLSDSYNMELFRKVVVDAVLGAAVELPVRGVKVTLEPRYHWGLMSRYTSHSGVLCWRQSALLLLLGLKVPLAVSHRAAE
jgi:hypothetical protein